jgi:hypothetical protein
MVKPLVHGAAWIDPHGIMDFPEDVDLIGAVDVEPTRKELRKGTWWVYANFFEPVGTRTSNAYCLQYQDKFDLILTCDAEILAKSKIAYFFPFGSCWIKPEDRKRNKAFGISMICGGKNWMPGHKIRREIWQRQEEVKTSNVFWRSSQTTPPGHENNPKIPAEPSGKAIAYDAMFNLCIENARDLNYFSEKLIDCFVTHTVPIYWGCENIATFFDTRGMILVPNANIAIEAANSVTPELYDSMKPYIDANEAKAQTYARPMAERVQEVIMCKIFGDRA